MQLLLSLASVAYLGWLLGLIVFFSFRLTRLVWIHRFFDQHCNIELLRNQPGNEISAVSVRPTFLLLFPVVRPDSVGLFWSGMTGNTLMVFVIFFVGIVVGWVISRQLVTYWNRLKQCTNEPEAKDSWQADDRETDWATVDAIRKRLSTGSAGDTLVGIQIGEGIHWHERGHMLCVGGSWRDKTDNLILPVLLSEGLIAAQMSVVCLDPKGESAAVAASHFIKQGYDVHILNPFGIAEIADLGNSRFNPFDLIDPASNEATKFCDMLAMALYNRKGQDEKSFFDNRCRQYISLYLSYAHHTGVTDWSMIYKWLIFSRTRRKDLLRAMATDATFDSVGMAEAMSDRLSSELADTEETIYNTIEDAIGILKDKNLRASLSGSDFDLKDVADYPTAIFLCIPYEDLNDHTAWVRLFFSSLVRTLTTHYNPVHKVIVLLNEFPQLSYVDEVVRSLEVLHDHNVTLWLVTQNLMQLKNSYGESWEFFLDNAVVTHWLGDGADSFTAEYVAKWMPQTENHSAELRKEIQPMPLKQRDGISYEHMICQLSGLPQPIKFKKLPYWKNPFCTNAL